MYNQAALELSGVPIIESYDFGKNVTVKFSSIFMTSKMSANLADKINKANGVFKITKSSQNKTVSYKANDNFKYVR